MPNHWEKIHKAWEGINAARCKKRSLKFAINQDLATAGLYSKKTCLAMTPRLIREDEHPLL